VSAYSPSAAAAACLLDNLCMFPAGLPEARQHNPHMPARQFRAVSRRRRLLVDDLTPDDFTAFAWETWKMDTEHTLHKATVSCTLSPHSPSVVAAACIPGKHFMLAAGLSEARQHNTHMPARRFRAASRRRRLPAAMRRTPAMRPRLPQALPRRRPRPHHITLPAALRQAVCGWAACMQQAVLSGVWALLGAGGWREAAVWPHSRWSALLPVSESVTAGLRERHLLSTACIWQLLLQDAVQVMCAVGVACDAAVTKTHNSQNSVGAAWSWWMV
jgi:hypothetical protein